MKKEQVVIPVAIGGAVVLVYLLTRKRPIATQTQMPGTLASGLPAYTPQAQQFNVGDEQLAPSPGLVWLPESQAPQLNFNASRGPMNLTYNMPTYKDLIFTGDMIQKAADDAKTRDEEDAKKKKSGACCGGCATGGKCHGKTLDCVDPCQDANMSNYTDGRGVCLNPDPSSTDPTSPMAPMMLSPEQIKNWQRNIETTTW